MSLEEKMLERFARERRKAHEKGSLFNLGDDDEDEEELILTHNNQVILWVQTRQLIRYRRLIKSLMIMYRRMTS